MDTNSDTQNRAVQKGQSIFKEGQRSTVAYMLKKGRVSLFRVLNNKKVILAQIKPGQIFGEEGLLPGQQRLANAVADETSDLILIDQKVFQTMLLKSPGPIQRLTKQLINQTRTMHTSIRECASGNTFLSICGVLELTYKAHLQQEGAGKAAKNAAGVSYAEFSKATKDILLISQLEIDEVVDRLAKLKIITINDARTPVMKKDALGKMRKTSDFLKDRYILISDLSDFMGIVRNLSQDISPEECPFTSGLEFIDIYDFAKSVGSTPEMLYKKMSYNEIPEKYFFLHQPTAKAWAKDMGSEFFKRVKRKRIKVEDLETINDIAYVDNATLQDAFSEVGFHKLAILANIAGEEARRKMFANLSNKMAKIVEEQALSIENLDDMEAADAEDDLLGAIKSIKGLTK